MGTLQFLAELYVAYVLLSFAHEGGHWLAGKLSGLQCVEFRVSLLVWRRARGWNFDSNWIYASTARIKQLPKPRLGAIWLRNLASVVGGPATNLALGFLALAILDLHPIRFSFPGILAMGSLWFGFANLIPIKVRGVESDGRQIIALLFTQRRRVLCAKRGELISLIEEVRSEARKGNHSRAIVILDEFLNSLPLGPDYKTMQAAVRKVRENVKKADLTIPSAAIGPVEVD